MRIEEFGGSSRQTPPFLMAIRRARRSQGLPGGLTAEQAAVLPTLAGQADPSAWSYLSPRFTGQLTPLSRGILMGTRAVTTRGRPQYSPFTQNIAVNPRRWGPLHEQAVHESQHRLSAAGYPTMAARVGNPAWLQGYLPSLSFYEGYPSPDLRALKDVRAAIGFALFPSRQVEEPLATSVELGYMTGGNVGAMGRWGYTPEMLARMLPFYTREALGLPGHWYGPRAPVVR